MGDSSVAAGALVPSVPKPDSAPSGGDAQAQALAEDAGASASPSPREDGEGAGGGEAAAAAAADKELLCPICMALIKDAFLTACGHSFCYMCIVTHLTHKSDCPCCSNYLTKAQLYPNFLLDKVLKKMSARQVAKTASPIEQLRHVVQQGNDMSVKELDSFMTLIAEKKRKMEQQESETNMQILLVFLHCLRKQKLDELNEKTEKWGIEKMIAMCVQEEERIKGQSGDSVNYLSPNKKRNFQNTKPQGKPQWHPSSSKPHGKSNEHHQEVDKDTCKWCKEKGHYMKDCVAFLKHLNKKGIPYEEDPAKRRKKH